MSLLRDACECIIGYKATTLAGCPALGYADSNFSGTSWELAEGTYVSADLNAGPIGNDAISSFLIPEGYEVTVYQFSGGTGNC